MLKIRQIVLFVFVLFSTGTLIYLFQEDNSANSGSMVTQIFLALIYLIASMDLISTGKKFYLELKYLPFLLFVVLCSLSIFWSIDMTTSARKVIGFVGAYIMSAYTVKNFTINEFLKFCYLFFLAAIGLSILISIAMPEYGTDDFFNGAWNGIYTHKNRLGRYVSLCIVLSIFIYHQKYYQSKRLLVLIFTIFISVFVLLKADSGTSIITLILSIFVAYLLSKVPTSKISRYVVSYLFVVIAVPLVFMTIMNFESLVTFFGKDITLTGRTYIWGLLILMSLEKIWLGFGYAGFWRGEFEEPSSVVLDLLGWYPSHAHNGYIDVYISVGIVGLGLFLYEIFKYLKRELKYLKGENFLGSPILLFFFILIYNLTESTFMTPNGFMWFLMLTILFYSSARIQGEDA